MKKVVVDSTVVLHLVGTGAEVAGGYKLLAPTLLRSQTLSLLRETVQRGDLSADSARDRLERIRRMPIRFLGDAKLRRRAWDQLRRQVRSERHLSASVACRDPSAKGGAQVGWGAHFSEVVEPAAARPYS